MDLRLRQVALVGRDKGDTVTALSTVLGLTPVHGSGNLARYGLPADGPMTEAGKAVLAGLGVENLLFAVGSDFLEVMFPTRTDGATVGFMDRRGGDTGYMVILQTDDVDRFKPLAEAEDVRITHEGRFPHYHDIHLHPRDCGGALLSMARHLPDNIADGAWYPGGEIWKTLPAHAAVSAIVAVEILSHDPHALAARWGRLVGKPAVRDGPASTIALDDGWLRFGPTAEGQKEGFYGLDLKVRDRARIERGARDFGIPITDDALVLCGMTIRLVE
jgi:hypothetical protein